MAEVGEHGRLGAYGLALPEVAGEQARYLGPAPRVVGALERRAVTTGTAAGSSSEWLWPRRARLRVSGNGWLEIDGEARHAGLHVPTGHRGRRASCTRT